MGPVEYHLVEMEILIIILFYGLAYFSDFGIKSLCFKVS